MEPARSRSRHSHDYEVKMRSVKRFFDDFFDSGVIPTVLTLWEMTGEKHAILEGGAR